MFENDFIVEFNDEELGECRTYPKNFKGYEQAIKDLKLYKAKQNQRIAELEEQLHELGKEKKRVYPFVKKYDNGIFIEYNVIYEREGLVSTMCFGKNKEMAYKFLKELQGE